MANHVDLKTYTNGYWGYMNEDVRYTISGITNSISFGEHTPNIMHVDDSGVAIIGTVSGIGARFSGLMEAADDTAAAGNGTPIDGLYNTAGVVKIRLV